MLQRLSGLICLALLAGIAHAATPEQRLVADHAAWTTARQGYEEGVATGALDADERRDYEAFLDDLAARVLAGCSELHALGRPAPEGVACPEMAPVAAAREPIANPNATSPEKDRATLDAELGASLGQFDELLLREQDRVRAARPRVDGHGGQASSSTAGGQGGTTAGTSGGQDGSETGSGTQGAQGAGEGTATAARGSSTGQGLPGGLGGSQGGDSGGDPGQGGLGAPAGSGAGATTPAELPNPSGDDVVARQLREAAQAERDPELRARLWEEYRRYRGGIN